MFIAVNYTDYTYNEHSVATPYWLVLSSTDARSYIESVDRDSPCDHVPVEDYEQPKSLDCPPPLRYFAPAEVPLRCFL